ncbi:MAG: hypothetical protein ACI3U2_07325 [Anaerovibrio sp.]
MTRKHSKSLEMLVGMALSAGLVLGIYPAEAFAQDFRVSYDGNSGNYIFADRNSSDVLAQCNENDFLSTWNSLVNHSSPNQRADIYINNEADKIAFESVIANGISVKNSELFGIFDSVASLYKFTVIADAGENARANISYSNGTLYCSGDIDAVDIQPGIGSDMNTIDLTGADTNIRVVDFSSVTSSAPTKNFMINADGKVIGNLRVEETFSVATADNSSVTVKDLNVRGGSVAAGAGATLTVTNDFRTMGGNSTVSGVTFLCDVHVRMMENIVGSNLTFNNLYISDAKLSNTDNGNITVNGSLRLEQHFTTFMRHDLHSSP